GLRLELNVALARMHRAADLRLCQLVGDRDRAGSRASERLSGAAETTASAATTAAESTTSAAPGRRAGRDHLALHLLRRQPIRRVALHSAIDDRSRAN